MPNSILVSSSMQLNNILLFKDLDSHITYFYINIMQEEGQDSTCPAL